MATKKISLALFCSLFFSVSFSQRFITIDSAGLELRKFYLSQHVDSLWITGHNVNWETGKPDDSSGKIDLGSHCSAFVAGVCKKKNIYILRPPAHDTELLANAQFTWLHSLEAADLGWHEINANCMETAQRLADSGLIVVAVYKNPNPKWSGHIAFVMPTEITTDSIKAIGPRMIQAGKTNSENISLRRGFGRHLKNWPPSTKDISFFFYDIRKNH
ncbi:MAG: hypothetical protein WCL06_09575 [Bacteroidota bacterium]